MLVPQALPSSAVHAVDGNWIVYRQYSASGVGDVYSYNLSTGLTQRLSTVSSFKGWPRISGSRVVWPDNRNGNFQIYTYDLSAGTEDLLIGGATGDREISTLSGSTVLYTSTETGYSSVFLATINPPTAPADTLPQACNSLYTNLLTSTPLSSDPVNPTQTSGQYIVQANKQGITKAYWMCIVDGNSDRSARTNHITAIHDGTTVLTQANITPAYYPNHYYAVQLEPAGSQAGIQHAWTVKMPNLTPTASLAVQIRVYK